MIEPTHLLAQCIKITHPNNTQSVICGPFPTPGAGGSCPTGNCFQTPGDVISRVMEYVFPFAGIILLFMIILSGYQMIVSRGESSKIQAATKRITYSLLGFGLLIVSYLMVKTISFILGFDSPI